MFRRLLPYAVIFLVLQTVLRLSLLARAFFDVEFTTSDVASVLIRGLWFDVVVAGFFLIPIAFYHLLLPANKHGDALDCRIDKVMRFVFSFVLLFDFAAEHLFWTEFTTRFNFIAVDYLIYTQEVIGNIVESYPLHWILSAVAVLALLIGWVSLRCQPLSTGNVPAFKRRAGGFVVLVLASSALCTVSTMDTAEFKDNAEATELAANGVYNLFHAFWHNEISYERFYATRDDEEIAHNARSLLFEEEEDVRFVHQDGKDLTRIVPAQKEEQHKNVMLVVMESMSAAYIGQFGNKEGLTPNLDRLANEGLIFTKTYATGTRTVRGLEAVTLSIPPTPGQSIVRRQGNDNLFSLGFVFKDRGYDTKFLYGGYGYFDNMNDFFSGNGFDVIDRMQMKEGEVNFANVWGVCDEDMFTRAIKEADASHTNGKHFFHLVMTTSNHRPYTYPEGRIDIASHSGRLGGVKYADYSVGKLIEEAKKKPWFKDTVFVFIADHTAGAGGKAELDPRKYHIPMIFYAPDMITPRRFENIASQIDLAPILLGLLGTSYYTKFYGEDLLNDADEIPHAFISNYQKVALVKEGRLTVLSPKRGVQEYSWPDIKPLESSDDSALANDAIAYYQSASWWKEHYKRIPTVVRQ